MGLRSAPVTRPRLPIFPGLGKYGVRMLFAHLRHALLYLAGAALVAAILIVITRPDNPSRHPIAPQQALSAWKEPAVELHSVPENRLVARHFDPQIRQASAEEAIPILLGHAALGQTGNGLAFTLAMQNNHAFPLGPTDPFLIYWPTSGPAAMPITFKGTAPATSALALTLDGNPLAAKPAPVNGAWDVILPNLGPAPTQTLNATQDTATVNLTLLQAGTNVQPAILSAGTNRFGPLVSLPTTTATPLNVFDGYAHISGQGTSKSSQLWFLVFDQTQAASASAPAVYTFVRRIDPLKQIVPNDDGSWDAELSLPNDRPTNSGAIVVVNNLPGTSNHSFASNDVLFTERPPLDNLPKPAITQISLSQTNGVLTAPYRIKQNNFWVSGTVDKTDKNKLTDAYVALFVDGSDKVIPLDATVPPQPVDPNTGVWTIPATVVGDGKHKIVARMYLGAKGSPPSDALDFEVRTMPPKIALDNATVDQTGSITIRFDEPLHFKSPLTADTAKPDFALQGGKSPQASLLTPSGDWKSLAIKFDGVEPGAYQLQVAGAALADDFDRSPADFTDAVIKQLDDIMTSATPGIHAKTGPYVPFPEFTPPRPIQNGFNPSDKVETRVAQLYYYRDAHRVAQIINRNVKSYNRAAVDMRRQLADKARQLANSATDARQDRERKAIEASMQARSLEHQIQQAQNEVQSAERAVYGAQIQLQQVPPLAANADQAAKDANTKTVNDLNAQSAKAEDVANAARVKLQSLNADLQTARALETQTNDQWQATMAAEKRAGEEQFRREVDAAHEDPDTYAPGKINSPDPVEQVSISVIGEGQIQLRGPIKGINEIRTMINQIDSPVGQVYISVDTAQVNGEHGDRMEVVADKIQKYIDHSRFLTSQSGEMLRKAIVKVAAMKAVQCGELPGLTQQERDRKYLYDFFGADFIHELEAMDSEFLKSGNKLLSLHSMDSTSLPSALFLMALAKNSTRMEILNDFRASLNAELPAAEENYFQAGWTAPPPHRLGTKAPVRPHDEDFQLLADNAKFESITGFFNMEIAQDDTMTPLQREFIRLAQIFKSRLIVEMELNQRVRERALIEERLGDRQADLEHAKLLEQTANDELRNAQKEKANAQLYVLVAVEPIRATIRDLKGQLADITTAAAAAGKSVLQTYNTLGSNRKVIQLIPEFDTMASEALNDALASEDTFEQVYQRFSEKLNDLAFPSSDEDKSLSSPPTRMPAIYYWNGTPYKVLFNESTHVWTLDSKLKTLLDQFVANGLDQASRAIVTLQRFQNDSGHQDWLDAAGKLRDAIASDQSAQLLDQVIRITKLMKIITYVAQYDLERGAILDGEINVVEIELTNPKSDFKNINQRWTRIDTQVTQLFRDRIKVPENSTVLDHLVNARNSFESGLKATLRYEFADQTAKDSLQRLDHKKFLDMLIDDMEDKYVELLEGTRAHTANVDGYIKRLTTALNDDFNTQFYYPAFRQVRTASRMWDVTLGQVETTSILANNRSFAKVSPQATMEFDLPKRDILINEAMNGAKAAVDDYGALLNDPTFLGMTKLNSGQPTSSFAAGSGGGYSAVRSVLPGLSTSTAEDLMAQQGPGNKSFGSALDSLIPDPAVYKFETGTGFEIRPVIEPDGQSVVFHFNYMYTTNVREPVRADEKHLGRVKQHYIDTDVQLGNFELREVSRYVVALKASRTSQGVPLLQDIPVAGVLFRPLPSAESSLQENIVMAQATVFPTLFDLMGLRWAPAVAQLDPLRIENDEFVVRNRAREVNNRVFDYSSSQVDQFLRIPEAERRSDLYRSQETIPVQHPNGYIGPGLNLRDTDMHEGYDPRTPAQKSDKFVPSENPEGSTLIPRPSAQFEPPLGGPILTIPLNTPPGQHPAAEAVPKGPKSRDTDLREGYDPRLLPRPNRPKRGSPEEIAPPTPQQLPAPGSPPRTNSPSGSPPANPSMNNRSARYDAGVKPAALWSAADPLQDRMISPGSGQAPYPPQSFNPGAYPMPPQYPPAPFRGN
jgi:hypothetical protein